MYSTHNEGKSVIAEGFVHWNIRFTIIWQLCQEKVYFDILNDIVDKYNNTYHRTNTMKLIDAKSGSYAEYSVDSNVKDAKFRIGNRVRISKYKNLFTKDMLLSGLKTFLWLVKSKLPYRGHIY